MDLNQQMYCSLYIKYLFSGHYLLVPRCVIAKIKSCVLKLFVETQLPVLNLIPQLKNHVCYIVYGILVSLEKPGVGCALCFGADIHLRICQLLGTGLGINVRPGFFGGSVVVISLYIHV